MELRELSGEQVTVIYHQYMVADFPQDELKPLDRILYMIKTGLCCAYGLYDDGKNGGELRGYATFIVPDGLRYGLLDYLAVLKEYRGTGVGHAFFDLVGDTLPARYPALRGFFIESEAVSYAADAGERQIREKRISFYAQNKCMKTPLGSRLFGVTYSVLLYDFYSGTRDVESAGAMASTEAVASAEAMESAEAMASADPMEPTGNMESTGAMASTEAMASAEAVASTGAMASAEPMVLIEDLDAVYRAMFPEHHYKQDVELWVM